MLTTFFVRFHLLLLSLFTKKMCTKCMKFAWRLVCVIFHAHTFNSNTCEQLLHMLQCLNAAKQAIYFSTNNWQLHRYAFYFLVIYIHEHIHTHVYVRMHINTYTNIYKYVYIKCVTADIDICLLMTVLHCALLSISMSHIYIHTYIHTPIYIIYIHQYYIYTGIYLLTLFTLRASVSCFLFAFTACGCAF